MPPAPQPVREQPATVMPIEAAPAAEVRARPAAQPVEVTPPEPAPVDPPKRVPRPLAEILAEMSVDELDAARHQTALTITHGQRRRAVVTAIQAARKAVASAKARADEAQARAAWWRPGSGGEAQQAQRALSREIRARDQALTHARDQGMKDISPKALASTLERFDAELERLMRGAEAMAAEATRRQAAEPAAKPVPVETTAQALQAAHREVQAAAERMARAQATGHPDTIAQAEDVRRRAEAALRAIEAARKAKVDADLARVVSRQSSAHTQHARQRGG